MVERTREGWGTEAPDRWIDSYSPVASVVSRAVWAGAVGEFVRERLRELRPAGPAIAARDARALARIAAWCAGEGMALDVELVLDPDTVECFVRLGLAPGRSQATYRADLRRIGRALTRRAPWEPRPEPLARRHVAAPYAPAQLSDLRRAARRQSTVPKQRAARALIALGAGAGLDGRWSTRVGAEDVIVGGGAVRVRVGEPGARSVPVLAGFEDEVVDLAEMARDGDYLVGGTSSDRNRASRLAVGFERPYPSLGLSAARLRSTWLVHHLEAGTRLSELVGAAGLSGATVLSDLLSEVAPLGTAEAVAMLRGA